MLDVIVVGAGPGGSVAAQKCVQNGFKTLLLEKRKLPRNKVCSGMVMGPWARDIIQQEFGEIPDTVLVSPHYLRGNTINVPKVQPKIIEWRIPFAWRKDLDFWMNQKAQENGVEIWDGIRVIRVSQVSKKCKVTVKKGEEQRELSARFVIGADGAASVVRKSLFPKLNIQYAAPLRECYKGSLDLEKDYLHWFFPKSRPRPRFNVNHKGEFFIIEGRALKRLRREITEVLAPYGFDPDANPQWRDGCLITLLQNDLMTGAFLPARGRILLIGDAAGLDMPVTNEGIGTALQSGLLAADSISKATRSGKEPGEIYISELKYILEVLKALLPVRERIEEAAEKHASAFAEDLKSAYEAALGME